VEAIDESAFTDVRADRRAGLPDYSAKTVEWLGAVHLPSVLPRDTLVRAVLELCTQYELRVYTCPFFGSPRGFPQVSPHGTMSSCIT